MLRRIYEWVCMSEAVIVEYHTYQWASRYAFDCNRNSFLKSFYSKFPNACCCINIFVYKNSVTGSYHNFVHIKWIELNRTCPVNCLALYPCNSIGVKAKTPGNNI